VERYLHAYGPATPAHFARWLAAPKRWAAELFASLAASGAIEEMVIEDAGPSWVVAGDTDFPAGPVRGVRLLPYFDAFAIASQPRERLFPGRAFERALGGGQAGNHPVLLVDGTVAGVWHQRRSGKRIAVTVEPLEPLPAARLRALEDEVQRVGAIMEGRAELTVGTVTVGPHAQGLGGGGPSGLSGGEAAQWRWKRTASVSPAATTKSPSSHRMTASWTSPLPSLRSSVPATVQAPSYGTGGSCVSGACCHWFAGTHQWGRSGHVPGVIRSVQSEVQVSRTDWPSAITNSTASGSPARPSGR